ncbi:MAG: hypothetical protein E7295_03515 [Lachnospiraceae bacterium]|nr:hypothetical protein [Lachnospiraceae bacterium]
MKRIMAFLGGILTCLALAGCSNQGLPGDQSGSGAEKTQTDVQVSTETKSQVTIAKSQEQDYVATFYSLQGGIADYRHVEFAGNYVYGKGYFREQSVYGVSRVSLESGWPEVFVDPNEGLEDSEAKRSVCCFDLTKDGGCVALVSAVKVDEDGVIIPSKEFYLCSYDKDGRELSCKRLEGVDFPNAQISIYMDMCVDGDGNIALVGDGVTLLSPDGELQEQISLDQDTFAGNLVRTKNGELRLSYTSMNGSGIKKVNFQKKCLEDVTDEMPGWVNGIGWIEENSAEEGDMIIYTNDYVYLYQEEKKECIPIVQWANPGIQGNGVACVGKLGEKVIAVSTTMELAILAPRTDDMPPQETLVLVTIQKERKLDEAVAAYNRSQNRYKVKVVEYGADATVSTEYQDPANRMMMDLLGEDSPDLINLSDFILFSYISPNLSDLVEKEYIEDLGPYLNRSAKLSREQYEEKAMELCTYQGVIAALPQSYRVEALAIDGSAFSGKMGWSVQDMITYDQADADMPLVDDCRAGHAFFLSCYYNLGAFVDFDNRQVNFDCPMFREMMEYSHTYRPGEAFFYYNAEEKTVKISSLDCLRSIQKIPLQSFDGNGQIIGFPTIDGTPKFGIDLDGDSREIGICKRSKNKDGAWDFIEFMQEYDLQNFGSYMNLYGGIPARKAILEKCFQELSDEKGPYGYLNQIVNDISYKYPPFTNKEREFFEEILKCAEVRDPRLQDVWNIVNEEAKTYFEGQKKLDAVIDVINQRVNLYLKEN